MSDVAFIQHNQGLAEGRQGLLHPVGHLPGEIVRIFEDGDHVFAHSTYDCDGPQIGFNVFLFEQGLIVEHWDNLQERPTGPNPSGRSMIDGGLEATDQNLTVLNKSVVAGFVEDVLRLKRMDQVSRYGSVETYLQHNPHVGDGAETMIVAFAKMDASPTPHRYVKVHKILGEGDFILAMSEGSVGSIPTAFYDLFRVDSEQIVEHWDVLQTIVPAADAANANGKF